MTTNNQIPDSDPNNVPGPNNTPDLNNDPGDKHTAASWRDFLSEELQADEKISEFKSADDLANAFLSTKRMVGGMIRIPTEDAGEEKIKEFNEKLSQVPGVVRLPGMDDETGWEELYRKLGRPEGPADYKIDRPAEEDLPKGMKYDEQTEKWFREIAHKAGLNNAQAGQIVGAYNEMIRLGYEERVKETGAINSKLRESWGSDYDRRVNIAQKVVEQYGGEDAWAQLEESGLGNNLAIIKIFADFGLQNLDQSLINDAGNKVTETNDELNAKLGELMANPAYLDKKNPQHNAIVQKVLDIQTKLTKGLGFSSDGGVSL